MCQGINGTVETTSPPATNPPIGNNSNGYDAPTSHDSPTKHHNSLTGLTVPADALSNEIGS